MARVSSDANSALLLLKERLATTTYPGWTSSPVTSNVTPMIVSFRCGKTALVFEGKSPKGFPTDIANVARRKLRQLHAATKLDDLRAPPGNRLEALSGNRAGQHSIRVNDQWRICFVWRDGNAHEVEMVDYH